MHLTQAPSPPGKKRCRLKLSFCFLPPVAFGAAPSSRAFPLSARFTAGRVAAVFALLLFALAPASLFGQHDVHATLIPSASRKPAPRFQLVGENGSKTGIAGYRGKVILLNFWATDCGGCILEIPSFIELQQAYRAKGFTAVGVAVDLTYENLKDADQAWGKVRPFVRSHKIDYPILMGDRSIPQTYNLEAYPDTFLLDKFGRIAAVYVGVVNEYNVAANIQTLLAER